MTHKKKILRLSFYRRDVLQVCEDLLGKYLVINRPKRHASAYLIHEVEAYDGTEDLACHASRGKTPRNQAMFEAGGMIYMYLIYGMYWMFNVVTGDKDVPCAVLIRGIGPYKGPGKLTQALKLDGSWYGKQLLRKTGLWIEDRGYECLYKKQFVRTPRIGLGKHCGAWKDVPYRYVLKPPHRSIHVF